MRRYQVLPVVAGCLAETEYESDEAEDHHDHLHHHDDGKEEGDLLLQLGLNDSEAAMGVDVEGRNGSVEDVTATVADWLVATGVRHGVVVTAVVVLPDRVAGVVVESPTTQVLALQGVPGPLELLLSHVLLHHPPDVGGQELLLEDDALELRAAVGRGGRRCTGGEEEAGEEEERRLPGPASALQHCCQGPGQSAQQVHCGAEEK